MTPPRRIDPEVGDSAYASGDHVWKGKTGAFTTKAIVNDEEQQHARRCRTDACARARRDRRS